jgi:hypothetical protein
MLARGREVMGRPAFLANVGNRCRPSGRFDATGNGVGDVPPAVRNPPFRQTPFNR